MFNHSSVKRFTHKPVALRLSVRKGLSNDADNRESDWFGYLRSDDA